MRHIDGDMTAMVTHALRAVARERLDALVVYGSAVTGDAIEGFSDFDVRAFLHGPFTIADCRALQGHIGGLDPSPCAYLQLATVDVDAAPLRHTVLVPGTFRVVDGILDEQRFTHDEESLRTSGRNWLVDLPALLHADARAWAVATGPSRTRLVRLLMTRLKPGLRALLAELGEPVLEVWAAPYDSLAERWAAYDPDAGHRLRRLVGHLPPPTDEEAAVGNETLSLLEIITQQATR